MQSYSMNIMWHTYIHNMYVPGQDGNTALHKAAQEGNVQMVRHLVDSNASITITNKVSRFLYNLSMYKST